MKLWQPTVLAQAALLALGAGFASGAAAQAHDVPLQLGGKPRRVAGRDRLSV